MTTRVCRHIVSKHKIYIIPSSMYNSLASPAMYNVQQHNITLNVSIVHISFPSWTILQTCCFRLREFISAMCDALHNFMFMKFLFYNWSLWHTIEGRFIFNCFIRKFFKKRQYGDDSMCNNFKHICFNYRFGYVVIKI